MASDPPLRVGDVACAAGVHVQTLHYYERRGLLPRPGRTAAGYRIYGPETVRTVRAIKRAQTLGFTLTDIRELMTPDGPPRARRELFARKMDEGLFSRRRWLDSARWPTPTSGTSSTT